MKLQWLSHFTLKQRSQSTSCRCEPEVPAPPSPSPCPGRHLHPPRRHVRRGRRRVLFNLKLWCPFVAAARYALPRTSSQHVSTDTSGGTTARHSHTPTPLLSRNLTPVGGRRGTASRPPARPTSPRHGLLHPRRCHVGLGCGTPCDGTPWRPATCRPHCACGTEEAARSCGAWCRCRWRRVPRQRS
jgi:hypothetical protein